MDWQAEWGKELGGRVFADERSCQEMSTDFGRVWQRRPVAVIRPESAQDVAATLKLAGRRSLAVTARGAGHSQNGQSLSDQLLLDMRGLDKVLRVDPDRHLVVCQAGITWRALLADLLPRGLSPPVLTNNLDVTLGGTMSTAGLGVASWRRGTQADHCHELEVVTGQGEIVRCSPDENAELFDSVRAGLGEFAIITEVTIKLRRHKPRCRSFYLLYDDLPALMEDLKIMMDSERFDYLESWCVPMPQGFTKADGQARPLAQWFFPLHATVETDGPVEALDQAGTLAGLRFYRHVHTEEYDFQGFLARLDPLFALWKAAGFWEQAHPWMECILPWEAAASYIPRVLQSIPAQMLQGGHILVWPARGSASSVPLFVRPEGEYLVGFGALLATPQHRLERVLPLLDHASRSAMHTGGKRYLSGWLNFDAGLWETHYGAKWPDLLTLKRRYDPHNVLNPNSWLARHVHK